jgi:FdhE protein
MTDATRRLAALEGQPGISQDLIALESRLLGWCEVSLAEIRERYPRPLPEDEALKTALRETPPLVATVDPLPEEALLETAAAQLATLIEDSLPGLHTLALWLRRGENRERFFLAATRGERPVFEELATAADLDPDALSWVGRQLARPFFHRLGELAAAHWPQDAGAAPAPGCPCCGGPARLGRYAHEESRRYLWCDLCDIQWPFPRITCPFCLNRDHEKLGFLTIEGVSNYRIDVCESCRAYLPAIDERELPEDQRTDFVAASIATVPLGMAAEKRGYHPGQLAAQLDDPERVRDGE